MPETLSTATAPPPDAATPPVPHVLDDPDLTAAAPTEAGWVHASAQFSAAVPDLADRSDLVVTLAPGAGHGAPGCHLPATASIEIDGRLLGVDPASVDTTRPDHADRYPTAWGVLVHEAAHARHTRWRPPPVYATAATDAALLLEEIRIEAAQTRRRPGDRRWLRAATTALILADLPTSGAIDRWTAAQTACLVLGRVDAHLLEPDEVTAVDRLARDSLSPVLLGKLRRVWRQALRARDTSGRRLLGLGTRWCRLLGADPHAPAPDGRSRTPTGIHGPALAGAIRAVAAAIDHTETEPERLAAAVRAAHTRRAAAARVEAHRRDEARRTAHAVFDPHPDPARAPLAGTRAPTGPERAAARRLARALRAAAHRDRAATTVASPTPPGRLSLRAALAADAQRAAGAAPTAQPWSRTVHRHTPTPPLRVGICCDVSSSMGDYTTPLASAAWILAAAAFYSRLDAATATVLFGAHVTALTRPRTLPTRVQEFTAPDDEEAASAALAALDGALELTRPGTARLLAILSDGWFRAAEHDATRTALHRLHQAGCALLWLTPEHGTPPATPATVLTLTDPTRLAPLLARACTDALRRAG